MLNSDRTCGPAALREPNGGVQFKQSVRNSSHTTFDVGIQDCSHDDARSR